MAAIKTSSSLYLFSTSFPYSSFRLSPFSVRQTLAVVVFAVAACLTVPVDARDPNYAITVNSTDENSNYTSTYRLVSLNWPEYLMKTDESQPKIYYQVLSVPLSLRAINVPAGLLYMYSTPSLKKKLVEHVFVSVLEHYLNLVLRVPKKPILIPDQVDPDGVLINEGRTLFNRTILISFEMPPYGQSRPNRLVTNIANKWTIWMHVNTDKLRFNAQWRREYDPTLDLTARYFHNIGHLLGFGHFIGSRTAHDQDLGERSVMFPNLRDYRYAIGNILDNSVDDRAMKEIYRGYDKHVERAARQNIDLINSGFFAFLKAAARMA